MIEDLIKELIESTRALNATQLENNDLLRQALAQSGAPATGPAPAKVKPPAKAKVAPPVEEPAVAAEPEPEPETVVDGPVDESDLKPIREAYKDKRIKKGVESFTVLWKELTKKHGIEKITELQKSTVGGFLEELKSL